MTTPVNRSRWGVFDNVIERNHRPSWPHMSLGAQLGAQLPCLLWRYFNVKTFIGMFPESDSGDLLSQSHQVWQMDIYTPIHCTHATRRLADSEPGWKFFWLFWASPKRLFFSGVVIKIYTWPVQASSTTARKQDLHFVAPVAVCDTSPSRRSFEQTFKTGYKWLIGDAICWKQMQCFKLGWNVCKTFSTSLIIFLSSYPLIGNLSRHFNLRSIFFLLIIFQQLQNDLLILSLKRQ